MQFNNKEYQAFLNALPEKEYVAWCNFWKFHIIPIVRVALDRY